VLLGPNLPHTWRSGKGVLSKERCHHAVDVQFRQDFLGKQFLSLEEMKPIGHLLGRSSSGLAFGHTKTGQIAAEKLAEFPSLSPSRRILSLLNILLDLAMEPDARTLSTDSTRPVCRVEDQKRIEIICAYLKDNFDQEIDFRAIARQVRMDQASLCRFFKRSTGNTMTAYVNQLRVGAAVRLLTETDRSTLEIGFTVGFGNYSNFHRQFKRIKGSGPRTLRQQFSSAEKPQTLPKTVHELPDAHNKLPA
jgi:AraC-like DNA-binding protein